MKSPTIFFIACIVFSILHSGIGGKYGRVIKNSFGKFKKPTKIYHGVRTSGDLGRTSHISVFKNKPKQCGIMGCNRKAQVGAHVYTNNNYNTQYRRVKIIPTCKRCNNRGRNRKNGQNFNGKGSHKNAQVVRKNTQYYDRWMSQDAYIAKGRGKGWYKKQ